MDQNLLYKDLCSFQALQWLDKSESQLFYSLSLKLSQRQATTYFPFGMIQKRNVMQENEIYCLQCVAQVNLLQTRNMSSQQGRFHFIQNLKAINIMFYFH